MAPSKKRKAAESCDNSTKENGGRPAKKPHKRSRPLVQRPGRAEQPPCNLIMKLPGELRNRIYRHVFGPPDRFWGWWSRKSAMPCREPALLLTSKAIRHEASSIFYVENRFSLWVHQSRLTAGCNWIGAKLASSGAGERFNFVLNVTGLTWANTGLWFSLARLVYKTDLGSLSRYDQIRYWKHRIVTVDGRLGDGFIWFKDCRSQGLSAVIEFAVDAKSLQLDEAQLKWLFNGWRAETLG